jgi:hypothetical protein
MAACFTHTGWAAHFGVNIAVNVHPGEPTILVRGLQRAVRRQDQYHGFRWYTACEGEYWSTDHHGMNRFAQGQPETIPRPEAGACSGLFHPGAAALSPQQRGATLEVGARAGR